MNEQELAHLRAEVNRLQAELSQGITALSECIGERDKSYKAGLLRAAQVCQDHRPRHGYNSATGWAIHDVAKAIEAEVHKGQP